MAQLSGGRVASEIVLFCMIELGALYVVAKHSTSESYSRPSEPVLFSGSICPWILAWDHLTSCPGRRLQLGQCRHLSTSTSPTVSTSELAPAAGFCFCQRECGPEPELLGLPSETDCLCDFVPTTSPFRVS